MGKFGSSFMMKSPIKKHGDQYREKARRLSEKSGTPGDYNRDDPKVNIELDKADKADADHKDSPLEGAYTSGAGGQTYVSNRQDFQQLQDRIAGAAISAIAGENDPQTQLERAQKRKAKIDDQGIKIKDGVTDKKGNAIYVDKDGKVINRGKQKLERAEKLQGKADAAQDLIDQRLKNKSTRFGVDDLTDDEAAVIKAMRLKK